MNGTLLSMHIPRRDYSQALACISHREGDVQTPAVCRLAERVVSGFPAAVTRIRKDEQGAREEHLLGLAIGNAMP